MVILRKRLYCWIVFCFSAVQNKWYVRCDPSFVIKTKTKQKNLPLHMPLKKVIWKNDCILICINFSKNQSIFGQNCSQIIKKGCKINKSKNNCLFLLKVKMT